jgi:hypothetical protein
MKPAASVAEQNGDSAVVVASGAGVGNDQAGSAVMVEVGDGNPAWAGTGGAS